MAKQSAMCDSSRETSPEQWWIPPLVPLLFSPAVLNYQQRVSTGTKLFQFHLRENLWGWDVVEGTLHSAASIWAGYGSYRTGQRSVVSSGWYAGCIVKIHEVPARCRELAVKCHLTLGNSNRCNCSLVNLLIVFFFSQITDEAINCLPCKVSCGAVTSPLPVLQHGRSLGAVGGKRGCPESCM